jgi:hypothetical protein
VEGLEQRRLLAAAPLVPTAAVDANGTLQVVGTRRADVISIATAGQIDVIAGGQAIGSFPQSGVTAVRVTAGGGHDQITVAADLAVPVTVLGEKGNDNLSGGSGGDSLDGGAGRDTLAGGAGNDALIGGAGKDVLRGDDGDDNCDGGSGNDDTDGGAGNDFLTGAAGRDLLRGGSGDDDLDGGPGSDDLGGDDGNDRVRGDSGRDACDGGSGDDDVTGGSGRDRIRGGDGRDSFDDNPSDRDRFEDRGGDDSPGDDGVHITPGELPAAVSTAFNAQFPGVTVREVERETEDEGIVYKIDFFDTNGLRRRAAYTEAGAFLPGRSDGGSGGGGGDDNGGGVGGGGGGGGGNDGQHIPPSELPAAVVTSFNTLFPGATIRETEREQEDGRLVYKIDFFDAQSVRRRADFTEAGQLVRQEVK